MAIHESNGVARLEISTKYYIRKLSCGGGLFSFWISLFGGPFSNGAMNNRGKPNRGSRDSPLRIFVGGFVAAKRTGKAQSHQYRNVCGAARFVPLSASREKQESSRVPANECVERQFIQLRKYGNHPPQGAGQFLALALGSLKRSRLSLLRHRKRTSNAAKGTVSAKTLTVSKACPRGAWAVAVRR